MKKSLTALAAASFAALCSPAMAATIVYTASLNGATESPPVASTGLGFAIVTLNDTTFTMRVQTIFSNLLGNTSASHIHCCTPSAGTGNAGVATTTPTFTGFPLGVQAGSYDQTFDMTLASSWNAAYITANGGTTSTAFAALASGLASGRAYLNIHSSFAGGGEIRGFLTASPVPEPASYALMALGLAAFGGLARRRMHA